MRNHEQAREVRFQKEEQLGACRKVRETWLSR